MYLLLKARKASVKNHPIIKRLYQYRQLLAQMDPVFEDQIKPQLEVLIEKAQNQPIVTKPTNKNKKLLNILKTAKEVDQSTSNKRKRGEKQPKSILKQRDWQEEDLETEKEGDKLITFASTKGQADSEDDESEGEEMKESGEEEEEAKEGEEEVDADGKRGITYQIAKNKGLMPKRKKEQRNPRVKHRNKFRKAKIRRKGAVREVRHEISRYGGEISGIKASVSKSIKLKS